MKKLKLIVFTILLNAVCITAQQERTGTFRSSPAWSRDGRHIAFVKMDVKGKEMKTDVYVIGADGSGLKQISRSGTAFAPAWSKDGKRVFFYIVNAAEKSSEIYSANADGADLKQITRNSGRNAAPDISPDGKRIVYNSERTANKPQISVMNIDGTNPKALTSDETIAFYNPVWSPNGKKITYYVEKGDQKDQIWVMDADGSNKKLLTADIAHNFYPSWSPDGKHIIFTSNRDGEQATYTMNADGTSVKRVKGVNSFNARFSPKGNKIVFISDGFPTSDLIVADVDGGNQVNITKQK